MRITITDNDGAVFAIHQLETADALQHLLHRINPDWHDCPDSEPVDEVIDDMERKAMNEIHELNKGAAQ